MTDMAIEKINQELAAFKGQAWEEIMKKDVAAALCSFCRQDEAFAKAVVEGGAFADCVRSISTSPRQMMSDAEAYERAVRFFFPGAEIRMQMTIDLGAGVRDKKPQAPLPSNVIALDLSSFL